MKNGMSLIITGLLIAGTAFGQGSLTPSSSPKATMKTLEQIDASVGGVGTQVSGVGSQVSSLSTQVSGISSQVSSLGTEVTDLGTQMVALSNLVSFIETRTAISSVPFTISQGGSYYLTSSISATGDGILITASHVTLDLNGFTLSGDGGLSDIGVEVRGVTNAPVQGVVISNGGIVGFGGGLRFKNSVGSRGVDLSLSSNDVGITFDGSFNGDCRANEITDSTITENQARGIYFYGFNGACSGNRIVDCILSRNVDRSIYLNHSDNNYIENNTISETAGLGIGITAAASSGNLIIRNRFYGNTTQISVGVSNTSGPLVTNTGTLPSTGDSAHPWANFSL